MLARGDTDGSFIRDAPAIRTRLRETYTGASWQPFLWDCVTCPDSAFPVRQPSATVRGPGAVACDKMRAGLALVLIASVCALRYVIRQQATEGPGLLLGKMCALVCIWWF